MLNQKIIFLREEGDRWYFRNKKNIINRNYKKDLYTSEIEKTLAKYNNIKKVLEVGCSDGSRIKYLKKRYKKNQFYGIDPSQKAINSKNYKDIKLFKGTADNLKFKPNTFELIIFSFCLYLCDDRDLKKILFESIRVLKKKGIILINDFYSQNKKYIKYKHDKRIKSRKMDCSKIFTLHNNISLISRKIYFDEFSKIFTDENLNKLAIYKLYLNGN